MKTCQFLCYFDERGNPMMINLNHVEQITRSGGDQDYTLLWLSDISAPAPAVPKRIQDVLRAMKDPKFAKMIGVEVV
jgi:hypothetical protein